MVKPRLSNNLGVAKEIMKESLISYAKAHDSIIDFDLIQVIDLNQYIKSNCDLFSKEELSVLFDVSIHEIEASLFIKVDHSLVNTINFIQNEKF